MEGIKKLSVTELFKEFLPDKSLQVQYYVYCII